MQSIIESKNLEDKKRSRKQHPEKTENIAVLDDKNIQKLDLNGTYSHFEESFTTHLERLLDVFENERIKPQEAPKKKKKEVQKVVQEETKVVDKEEVKEDQLYTFYKNLNIENRFDLKYGAQNEILASEINGILNILDVKQHKTTQISNHYFLSKMIKQKPHSNQLEYNMDNVKAVAQYYFDCDYVMYIATHLPELKKKDIKQSILSQIMDFAINYFNSSTIEMFDPEFYITVQGYIEIYQDFQKNTDNTFNDKFEQLVTTVDKLAIKTRQRLEYIREYIENPETYFLEEPELYPLYQLINFKYGDFLWTIDYGSYEVTGPFVEFQDNFYSSCIPGYIYKQYHFGTLPILIYYHKFYKYHYYTVDIEEIGQTHRGKTGYGMWLYKGILGYILPNEIGDHTVGLHKYYNKDKNKMFYTTNNEDITILPSTNQGYLSHSTEDNFIKKHLLDSKTFEKNDEYVYIGVLGYLVKAKECWVQVQQTA